eukprot:EG_transcript_22972
MSNGFVVLATQAVDDFVQLVLHLIGDSGAFASSVLDSEYMWYTAQLNLTGFQFLQATLSLMALAKNATIEVHMVVAALLVSMGDFTTTALSEFQAVGADAASYLRIESASQTQTYFQQMLQGRITAVQRQAQLYEMGMLNFSRRAEDPLDEGTCILLGSLCAASEEINRNLFIGMASGNIVHCDVTLLAYTRMLRRGATSDLLTLMQWPPFDNSDPNANFSRWRQACLAGSDASFLNVSCPHGTMMDYPANCNGTCGFDPRCRPWYTVLNNNASLASGKS